MNNETQNLIISILGLDSILCIVGLFLIVIFTHYDSNLILALIPTITTPITLLGGFLTGKSFEEGERDAMKRKIAEQKEELEKGSECEKDTLTECNVEEIA